MQLKTLVEKEKIIGLLGLIIVSSGIIFFFYGDILQNPNNVFFAPRGDGLKSSFGSYYHYNYDTSYMHTNSMNYPFGESVFFTGNQPLVVNTLKFLSSFGLDFSDNLIGVLNVWMIFTIFLGIIFLYLLLYNLGLPSWFSGLAALIIAFLSPQIERFTGHYNLAYLFILPMLLLFLNKYYRKPSWVITVFNALVAFLAMYVHGYFYAFYTIWVVFLIATLVLKEKNKFPLVRSIIQGIIMIVLPLLLFQMITTENASDRTAYPWGGIQSAAFLKSVFLPVNSTYGKFLGIRGRVSYYIGFTSTVIFIILLTRYIINFWKNRSGTRFTNNTFLNGLFLGSIVALIFSFVWPFRWSIGWPVFDDLSFLLNYMGPLRQFRGTGRFSWLFYYSINLISFYFLWQWYKEKKSALRTIIILAILLFGSFEAFDNVKSNVRNFNNRIALIDDAENNEPLNHWVNEIEVQDYQAIIPFPFFHVGSETFWLTGGGELHEMAFIASWKTGLPLTSVMLSRTSITQTMISLELVFEPHHQYRILDQIKSNKDFLVLHDHRRDISASENNILEYSIPISKNERFSFYKLPVDSLVKLNRDYSRSLTTIVLDKTQNNTGDFISTDSMKSFIYESFANPYPKGINDGSDISFKVRRKQTILDTTLFENTDTLLISLWVDKMNRDLLPRTRLQVITTVGDEQIRKFNTEIFRKIKYVTPEGWGLLELEYIPKKPNEHIVISAYNDYTTNEVLSFDDVLIRAKSDSVFFRSNKTYYMNNRYIKLQLDH